MTAKEKQLRAAEAAGVAQFYIKKIRATCAASCGSARLIECTMRSVRSMLFVAVLLLQALAVHSAAAPPEEEEPEVPPHSDEEVTEAREEFDSIDTNKDGYITKEEILEMDEVPEKEEIEEFFGTYDTNKDGRVTFDEILQSDDELRNEADEEEQQTEL